MKHKLIFAVMILAGCFTILLVIINNRFAEQIKKNQSIALEEDTLKLFQFNQMNMYINEQLNNVSITDVQCEDVDNRKFNMSTLVFKNSVLIYRYSELNCNTCYESELAVLQEIFLDADNDKVAILCSYQIRKYFTTFKKINQIKLPIYRISQDSFNWIVEDYGNPYYFILHPDMTVSDFYIPDKVYPELNRKYLENVKMLINRSS
jgi:hypothetical protein